MIVFFDVDHTLIPKTSTDALFIRWLLLHDKISVENIFLTGLFFVRHLNDIGGTALRRNKLYLKGMSVEEFRTYTQLVGEKVIKKRISEDGIKEIKKLKSEGKKVILLSAGLKELVQYVHKIVGSDDYIATEPEVREGKLTGLVREVHPYGERKRTVALEYTKRHIIPLKECSAYGNSASDIPLLEAVGKPIAVNPSRRLRRFAKERKWPICNFS